LGDNGSNALKFSRGEFGSAFEFMKPILFRGMGFFVLTASTVWGRFVTLIGSLVNPERVLSGFPLNSQNHDAPLWLL
jgi:hypothetical protein